MALLESLLNGPCNQQGFSNLASHNLEGSQYCVRFGNSLVNSNLGTLCPTSWSFALYIPIHLSIQQRHKRTPCKNIVIFLHSSPNSSFLSLCQLQSLSPELSKIIIACLGAIHNHSALWWGKYLQAKNYSDHSVYLTHFPSCKNHSLCLLALSSVSYSLLSNGWK